MSSGGVGVARMMRCEEGVKVVVWGWRSGRVAWKRCEGVMWGGEGRPVV